MGSDISINAIRSDLEQISKKLTPAYEIWMESSEGETGAADLPEWIPTYLQSDLKQTEKKLHQYRNDVLTASRTTQGRSPWSKRQKRRVGILELYENCIFMHSALHIATRMASGASIEPTSVHQVSNVTVLLRLADIHIAQLANSNLICPGVLVVRGMYGMLMINCSVPMVSLSIEMQNRLGATQTSSLD